MYRIGFYGCAHLGYRMNRMNRSSNGTNLREIDGFTAHNLIYDSMLAAKVDGIVDGGDLFHTPHPSVRAVEVAIAADNRRVANPHNIWRLTNGGNHDNGAATHLSAVSHVHRIELGSKAVFPDTNKLDSHKVGPHPGLYEIHQPDLDRELFIHIISHNGLDPALADRGIHIDPQPIADATNILVSHGMFAADDRLFGAVDRHGAERVIPTEWVTRGFDQHILSDYHTQGPIPGFGPEDGYTTGQVWMTGSGLRRGYSDDVSERGWLELRIADDGHTSIVPHSVWQRPQVDFDVIDARGKTAPEIDEMVRTRLRSLTTTDAQSQQLTGDGGVIARQRITHTTPVQRQDLGAYRAEWAAMANNAAYWCVDYQHPQTTTNTDSDVTTLHPAQSASHINFREAFIERTSQGTLGALLDTIGQENPDRKTEVVARVANTLEGLASSEA